MAVVDKCLNKILNTGVKMNKLFEKGKLGDIEVKNRVFMAPLTRNRALPDGTPQEMAVKYYAQRASAGLIFTEGAQISAEGKGYINTPGIYNEKQKAVWKKITDAVHERGGKIVLQLWHVGRVSHTSLLPENSVPLAPSKIKANTQVFNADGPVDVSEPRELSKKEIKNIVSQYVDAAKLAIAAGFDGVEVHGANGYLLNQFISTNSNTRTDEYGGSPENRARLFLETVDAVVDAVGVGKVGARLSPTVTFNDIHDTEISENYTYIYSELNKRNLAFLHVCESFPGIETSKEDQELVKRLKNLYKGNYISNGGYEKETAVAAIEENSFAVTFGRPFISNPDLPERLQNDFPLAEADADKFYGGDETGYSDYPTYKS